jgi:hypothetical protein
MVRPTVAVDPLQAGRAGSGERLGQHGMPGPAGGNEGSGPSQQQDHCSAWLEAAANGELPLRMSWSHV